MSRLFMDSLKEALFKFILKKVLDKNQIDKRTASNI